MKRALLFMGLLAVVVGCNEKKPGMPPTAGDGRKAEERGWEAKPAEAKADMADAMAGSGRTRAKVEALPPSGLLTAGSFDDNQDAPAFMSMCRRTGAQTILGDWPTRLQGRRLMLNVRDAAGKPINNALVRLEGGGRTVEATTRSDGRAIFVATYDQFPADQALAATIIPADGSGAVRETITAGAPRWDVTLPKARGALPKNLDLMIVLDATGSMGDEMRHLAAEIKGISQKIQAQFPDVQQRFSLVLYRDDGDAYVTRRFEFTKSLKDFHTNLASQQAGGGGDTPEAMHRGLEDAVAMRWRDQEETACLLFLVADAPPHAQHITRTMNAVERLRHKGVAIYPIACSGYDEPCEFVMRASAYLTGGQFLFLTDDSGIGGSHAEPRVPYYQVERLEKLIVRMIASELSGRTVLPAEGDVLRRVGQRGN